MYVMNFVNNSCSCFVIYASRARVPVRSIQNIHLGADCTVIPVTDRRGCAKCRVRMLWLHRLILAIH